nr:hypothetical protein [Tanacetum cinerariifolium]
MSLLWHSSHHKEDSPPPAYIITSHSSSHRLVATLLSSVFPSLSSKLSPSSSSELSHHHHHLRFRGLPVVSLYDAMVKFTAAPDFPLVHAEYTVENSQTNKKTDLGYNTQVFTRAMFDCDDYLSSESDESWPPSSLYDMFQPSDGYHAVPLPYTKTFMPPKPDFVFNTAPTAVETFHSDFTIQLSPTKPDQDLSYTNRPTTPIIEGWVSDSKDESETKALQIIPSFVQSSAQVKSLWHSVQHIKTSIPAATSKPTSLKSASSGKSRNRKACFVGNRKQCAQMTHHNPQKHMVPAAVFTQSKPKYITAVRPVSAAVPQIKGNPQLALKDKRVIDSGCSRNMTGNITMLTTRSGIISDAINRLIAKCVAEALTAHTENQNNGNRNGNGNGNRNGNGNGNGNGNKGGNHIETNGSAGGVMQATHGCTYKEILNSQPHKFSGTEGVVGLAM